MEQLAPYRRREWKELPPSQVLLSSFKKAGLVACLFVVCMAMQFQIGELCWDFAAAFLAATPCLQSAIILAYECTALGWVVRQH
jgi:hypothetical protein